MIFAASKEALMTTQADEDVPLKLTSYSHGGGCGCKIAPAVLDEILSRREDLPLFPGLLVGHESRDDAAVLDIGSGMALISTTDFFMPVVDDPFDFGRIAAANAISDVYAMGGKPLLAVAILGWPVNKLSPAIAAQVVEGGRSVCTEAGIPLAGGHSIDSPEPIFGLAVNGMVAHTGLKKNNTAKAGDLLFLTKPVGTGILNTAMKRGKALPEDLQEAVRWMTTLNRFGEKAGRLTEVHAITDVTGFGLFGHLLEMTGGSHLTATIHMDKVPLLSNLDYYLDQYIYPDMTTRNFNSYKDGLPGLSARQLFIGCDPQTSGGLLLAVDPAFEKEFLKLCRDQGLGEIVKEPVGVFSERKEKAVMLN